MAKETEIESVKPTQSQRFTSMVVREFGAEVGTLNLDPYQQRLAQHLFIGIDTALRTLEAKRLEKNKTGLPIEWANINLPKLATDSVFIVELGLDALVKNHVHVVPYFNGTLKKYDVNLQVGYVGKDYYKREYALVKPKDIIYELVHENDEFEPIMKSADNPVETYKYRIPNPFNRGDVVGGFGYIMYEDKSMNRLIIVDDEAFKKAKKAAKTNMFWDNHPTEMKLVTLVRRVTDTLKVDPKKVNAAYANVELADAEHWAQNQIEEGANQTFIDIEPTEPTEPVMDETPAKPPKEPKATGTNGPLNQPDF